MKTKIEKLRSELKKLNKPQPIKTKKKNRDMINVPYIKKDEIIYTEEIKIKNKKIFFFFL